MMIQTKTQIYLVSLVLLFQVCATYDYQDRCVYCSEKDGLCCSSRIMDNIEIHLDIEGKGQRVLSAWGGTSCDSRISSCSATTFVAKAWLITEEGDAPFNPKTQIPMVQETKKVTDIFGRVKQIIARAKVEVGSIFQTKIDYQPYRCVVFGDGQVHHFAGPSTGSKMSLRCDRLLGPLPQLQ